MAIGTPALAGSSNATIIAPLGQQLANDSIPVVLTAAQVITLTPPAALTNYALESGGNLASAVTSLQLLDNAVSGAGFNITQLGGIAISMNTGVRDTGTQRVTIATNDAVPVTNAGITTIAGAVSGSEMQVDVLTMPTTAVSQSGTWTVQPGNTPNSIPWIVTDTPSTTGGLSKFHLVGAATDNATNVKASAGQVYAITAFNVSADERYLKFHNTAGTPTAGSGVTDTYLIPGNTAGSGVAINIDKGIPFGTGIGITLVTGIADNDTAAIGASEVVVNIYYK